MSLRAAADCFSYEGKEQLCDLLSEIIEKATGDQDGNAVNRVERSLNRFVIRQWNLLVTEAIKSVLSYVNKVSASTLKTTDQKKIEKTIETTLSKITSKVETKVKSDIEQIYKLNLSRFQSTHKIGKRNVQKAGLANTDQLIVDTLTKLHLISVNDHYTNNHKAFISEMIKQNVIDQGLPKKEAGTVLQEQISQRLGGFDQAVPESIRNQGQGAASAYFEGLSATSVTRARNFGQINLMDEAGITQVMWSSVMDDRTSDICASMNGRVFTIDMVKAQQTRILEQDTSDAVANLYPWRKDLSEFNLKPGERLSSFEASNLLASSGVPIVPPAHFRCRSELVPA